MRRVQLFGLDFVSDISIDALAELLIEQGATRPDSWRVVVTPNIVSATAGLLAFDWTFAPCATMPASACAALASTRSEIRLMPEISVTEYIMQMSDGPT